MTKEEILNYVPTALVEAMGDADFDAFVETLNSTKLLSNMDATDEDDNDLNGMLISDCLRLWIKGEQRATAQAEKMLDEAKTIAERGGENV